MLSILNPSLFIVDRRFLSSFALSKNAKARTHDVIPLVMNEVKVANVKQRKSPSVGLHASRLHSSRNTSSRLHTSPDFFDWVSASISVTGVHTRSAQSTHARTHSIWLCVSLGRMELFHTTVASSFSFEAREHSAILAPCYVIGSLRKLFSLAGFGIRFPQRGNFDTGRSTNK